jgi:hypothetical protein
LSETVTQSVEFQSDAGAVFRFASDASVLPAWAPAFAPQISRISEHVWEVVKAGETFRLRVAADEKAGTVDFIRQVAPGVVGGARLLVVPKPDGGSVLTMTVPIPEGSSEDSAAAIARSELGALRHLLDGH